MTDCLAEPRLLLFFCGKGVGLRAAMVAVGFRPRWPELPDVRTGEFSDLLGLRCGRARAGQASRQPALLKGHRSPPRGSLGWITEERVMEEARVGGVEVVELARRRPARQ
ncbi:unnamed protein product [Arctogadus glacialis]